MAGKLTIVADENIPLLDELLADHADIHRLPGRTIKAGDITSADALLTRSVTRVDKNLLQEHSPAFIGSCTIGVDHIDLGLLAEKGIRFAHAPGCNAAAVVDYVLTALLTLDNDIEHWQQSRVGIIGLGEVGSRLYHRLGRIGIETRAYDPFKPAARHSLDEVLACDVVSLHVPLTREVEHSTFHMIGRDELARLADHAVLINSSRGAVVNNNALLEVLAEKPLRVVMDVYEEEPSPPDELLKVIDIATAHIAGYSLHGKMRGTLKVVEAMADFFDLSLDMAAHGLAGRIKTLPVDCDMCVSDVVRAAYDIRQDSADFIRAYLSAGSREQKAVAFDTFRKQYQTRYEFAYQELQGDNRYIPLLKAIGFDASLRE